MKEHPPTRYQIFRYDPELEEVVLVREGVADRLDPDTMSPKLKKILADAREEGKRFEQQLKDQARKHKSS